MSCFFFVFVFVFAGGGREVVVAFTSMVILISIVVRCSGSCCCCSGGCHRNCFVALKSGEAGMEKRRETGVICTPLYFYVCRQPAPILVYMYSKRLRYSCRQRLIYIYISPGT